MYAVSRNVITPSEIDRIEARDLLPGDLVVFHVLDVDVIAPQYATIIAIAETRWVDKIPYPFDVTREKIKITFMMNATLYDQSYDRDVAFAYGKLIR